MSPGGGPSSPAARKRAPALALIALAVGVILPGLGTPGLWEPDETAVAKAAVDGELRMGPGAAFRPLLPALGLSLFGASETGARLPGALLALVVVGLVLGAGVGLGGRRVGMLAAATLVTMPGFVMGARHLTSEMPALAGFVLAVAGLGGFAVIAGAGGRRWLLLATGALGLALGTLSGGLLVGAVAPALAAALARLSLRDDDGGTPLASGRGVQPIMAAVGLAAAPLLVVCLTWPHAAGLLSWRLGGTPVASASATFEGILRTLGFATFPWAGLALFALLRPLGGNAPPGPASDAPGERQRRFVDRFLLLAAALGLALATLRLQLTGEITLAFLPALALALGRFLDQMLSDRDRGSEPLLGLLLAAGAIILARDLGQAPVELVTTHFASQPTWPVTLEVRGPLMAVGIAAAAACLLLVAVPRSALLRPAAGRWPPLLLWLRQAAPLLLLGTAAGQALWLSHGLLPALGHHLSPKRLFATFEGLRPASTSATLGIYAGAAREAPWAGQAKRLDSVSALADSLAAPGDHFAVIPRAELGRIDRQLADRGLRYAVADDSSSRLLLLASRLPAGAGDRNPLNHLRWRPSLATTRPWKAPGRPVAATFGGAIDLVGADFPAHVRRPAGLPVTLFLRARATPPPDHQIFVHLERPGTLLNGDHPPLGGIFPTTLWAAGDHLRDRHLVPLPLVLAPPGTYRVLVGFWPGGNTDRRLPVSSGDHDGRHRVYLGTVEVR